MTLQPVVSVIVPIYNVSPYIATFARSLFAQTYPAIEFIFVDDGSQDDSVSILRRIAEEEYPQLLDRIHIHHQTNQGLPSARLAGLRQATGTYILHADSDDWMEPDLVEVLVKESLATGADVTYCDIFKEKQKKTSIIREEVYPPAGLRQMFTDLIHGRKIHGYVWNKLVHRSLYTPELVWPKYSMREDFIVTIQLLARAKCIRHVAKPLYHYRRNNPGSITRKDFRRKRRECAENMLLLYEALRHKGSLAVMRKLTDEYLVRAAYYAVTALHFKLFENYPYIIPFLMAKDPARKTGLSRGKQRLLYLAIRLYQRFSTPAYSSVPRGKQAPEWHI